jgi:hypothetical protein
MIPTSIKDWARNPDKRICLIGMSGVGKTRLSHLLRETGPYYHYAVDYRIGSHYLIDEIDGDLRRAAMRDEMFRALLRSDGITIKAKLGINNLDAMSSYLGKIGDPKRGGLSRDAFLERQLRHLAAERKAMLDVGKFIEVAREVFEYEDFVCDASGSLCSAVDPWDSRDPILAEIARDHLIVYIEGSERSRQTLIDRFRARPKPIFYSEAFFAQCEAEYLKPGTGWEAVDPDHFAVWAFERLIAYRLPRYQAIADNWGVTLSADEVGALGSASAFCDALIDAVSRNRGTPAKDIEAA